MPTMKPVVQLTKENVDKVYPDVSTRHPRRALLFMRYHKELWGIESGDKSVQGSLTKQGELVVLDDTTYPGPHKADSYLDEGGQVWVNAESMIPI